MAINLATKYSDKIAEYFTAASVLKGRGSNDYTFEGVKTVKIYTPLTVALTDYTRSGTSRYGNPTEIQDTVQEMTLSQDKSFALTIDKGNNMEQLNTKGAMKMLRLEVDERVKPAFEQYGFSRLAVLAGDATEMGSGTTLTKNNIVEKVAQVLTAMDNAAVPSEGRNLYITASAFNLLRQSPEYIGNKDLGKTALVTGQVGEFMNARVIKVMDSYMPTGVHLICAVDKAFVAPWKINDTKAHNNPPGINGDLLEGRFMWDLFVIGAKASGVHVLCANGSRQATPTITISSHSATIASTGATKILYTLDGTDPRYSETAQVYSSAVTTTAGETVKAVAYKTGSVTSAVAQRTDA